MYKFISFLLICLPVFAAPKQSNTLVEDLEFRCGELVLTFTNTQPGVPTAEQGGQKTFYQGWLDQNSTAEITERTERLQAGLVATVARLEAELGNAELLKKGDTRAWYDIFSTNPAITTRTTQVESAREKIAQIQRLRGLFATLEQLHAARIAEEQVVAAIEDETTKKAAWANLQSRYLDEYVLEWVDAETRLLASRLHASLLSGRSLPSEDLTAAEQTIRLLQAHLTAKSTETNPLYPDFLRAAGRAKIKELRAWFIANLKYEPSEQSLRQALSIIWEHGEMGGEALAALAETAKEIRNRTGTQDLSKFPEAIVFTLWQGTLMVGRTPTERNPENPWLPIDGRRFSLAISPANAVERFIALNNMLSDRKLASAFTFSQMAALAVHSLRDGIQVPLLVDNTQALLRELSQVDSVFAETPNQAAEYVRNGVLMTLLTESINYSPAQVAVVWARVSNLGPVRRADLAGRAQLTASALGFHGTGLAWEQAYLELDRAIEQSPWAHSEMALRAELLRFALEHELSGAELVAYLERSTDLRGGNYASLSRVLTYLALTLRAHGKSFTNGQLAEMQHIPFLSFLSPEARIRNPHGLAPLAGAPRRTQIVLRDGPGGASRPLPVRYWGEKTASGDYWISAARLAESENSLGQPEAAPASK